MKYCLLLFASLMHLIVYTQSVSIEKVHPVKDSIEAEGIVYKKGNFEIKGKSQLQAGIITLDAFVENKSDGYVHFSEAEVTVVYNKTTKNAKGIYKTVEKNEKIKAEDIILEKKSAVVFKGESKLDQRSEYKIVYITGIVTDDKVTILSPSTEENKIKLDKDPVACNSYLNIDFSFFLKEEDSKDILLADGKAAKKYIPYLLLKNNEKQAVVIKGKLDVAFSYNGAVRHLKFNLPNLDPGEQKEVDAKGAIPTVNYVPSVYYLQALNKPAVTFKTDDK